MRAEPLRSERPAFASGPALPIIKPVLHTKPDAGSDAYSFKDAGSSLLEKAGDGVANVMVSHVIFSHINFLF
ncbi:hypothetical protein O9H85_12795 [Paenibacillus filicis]|uniref:Uncharacterized protein n=1 Tax=Paenibacillus gyeongsangnamensis TaxID=3388067 RepID=A0ABT4Q8Y7_9BACL|nr:hypothetical protein [Paenibacillus filicis]MCZ8513286.1 hypothetical protein [Paenibacillus filicis]